MAAVMTNPSPPGLAPDISAQTPSTASQVEPAPTSEQDMAMLIDYAQELENRHIDPSTLSRDEIVSGLGDFVARRQQQASQTPLERPDQSQLTSLGSMSETTAGELSSAATETQGGVKESEASTEADTVPVAGGRFGGYKASQRDESPQAAKHVVEVVNEGAKAADSSIAPTTEDTMVSQVEHAPAVVRFEAPASSAVTASAPEQTEAAATTAEVPVQSFQADLTASPSTFAAQGPHQRSIRPRSEMGHSAEPATNDRFQSRRHRKNANSVSRDTKSAMKLSDLQSQLNLLQEKETANTQTIKDLRRQNNRLKEGAIDFQNQYLSLVKQMKKQEIDFQVGRNKTMSEFESRFSKMESDMQAQSEAFEKQRAKWDAIEEKRAKDTAMTGIPTETAAVDTAVPEVARPERVQAALQSTVEDTATVSPSTSQYTTPAPSAHGFPMQHRMPAIVPLDMSYAAYPSFQPSRARPPSLFGDWHLPQTLYEEFPGVAPSTRYRRSSYRPKRPSFAQPAAAQYSHHMPQGFNTHVSYFTNEQTSQDKGTALRELSAELGQRMMAYGDSSADVSLEATRRLADGAACSVTMTRWGSSRRGF